MLSGVKCVLNKRCGGLATWSGVLGDATIQHMHVQSILYQIADWTHPNLWLSLLIWWGLHQQMFPGSRRIGYYTSAIYTSPPMSTTGELFGVLKLPIVTTIHRNEALSNATFMQWRSEWILGLCDPRIDAYLHCVAYSYHQAAQSLQPAFLLYVVQLTDWQWLTLGSGIVRGPLLHAK